MTKYTADDFKHARFATKTYEGGNQCLAVAHQSRDSDRDDRWTLDCTSVGRSDQEMAADPGWSIVRDADTMTARDHLDAAWEKAHVVDRVPAGTGYIIRDNTGAIYAVPDGYPYGMSGKAENTERRLLDPPAPAWHQARIIEATYVRDTEPSRWARTEAGDWVCLSSGVYGLRAASDELRDVTVIVGAEQ